MLDTTNVYYQWGRLWAVADKYAKQAHRGTPTLYSITSPNCLKLRPAKFFAFVTAELLRHRPTEMTSAITENINEVPSKPLTDEELGWVYLGRGHQEAAFIRQEG